MAQHLIGKQIKGFKTNAAVEGVVVVLYNLNGVVYTSELAEFIGLEDSKGDSYYNIALENSSGYIDDSYFEGKFVYHFNRYVDRSEIYVYALVVE